VVQTGQLPEALRSAIRAVNPGERGTEVNPSVPEWVKRIVSEASWQPPHNQVFFKIFLCHASEDKAQVREVYHRLRAIDGFEPWLDEENLLPGQDWDYEVKRALKTSDFILIFLSCTSVAKRGYVQREMKLALDVWQELPEGTIHTIPVRLDDCDVPEQFRRYHWTNLFAPNGFDRIVRAIRAELAKRPVAELMPILEPSPRTSLSEVPATQAPALIQDVDEHVVLEKDFRKPYFSPRRTVAATLPSSRPKEDLAKQIGADFAAAWVKQVTSEEIQRLKEQYPRIPSSLDANLLKEAEKACGSLSQQRDLRRAVRMGFWEGVQTPP
jgi:hypothetical protein